MTSDGVMCRSGRGDEVIQKRTLCRALLYFYTVFIFMVVNFYARVMRYALHNFSNRFKKKHNDSLKHNIQSTSCLRVWDII